MLKIYSLEVLMSRLGLKVLIKRLKNDRSCETVVLRTPLEKIMFREADSNGSDLPHLVLFM